MNQTIKPSSIRRIFLLKSTYHEITLVYKYHHHRSQLPTDISMQYPYLSTTHEIFGMKTNPLEIAQMPRVLV